MPRRSCRRRRPARCSRSFYPWARGSTPRCLGRRRPPERRGLGLWTYRCSSATCARQGLRRSRTHRPPLHATATACSQDRWIPERLISRSAQAWAKISSFRPTARWHPRRRRCGRRSRLLFRGVAPTAHLRGATVPFRPGHCANCARRVLERHTQRRTHTQAVCHAGPAAVGRRPNSGQTRQGRVARRRDCTALPARARRASAVGRRRRRAGLRPWRRSAASARRT